MNKNRFATYPSLEAKVIYITGGASGIGYETVKAFAQQKSIICFFDIDDQQSNNIIENYSNVYYFKTDLRDINQLNSAFRRAKKKVGPANVLVNNAARDDRHNWQEVSADYWDERFATNLRHMFFAIQSVAPDMINAKAGSIINLGSNSWWEKGTGFPAYATAKSAVHGLTRTMAKELGVHRIRVNTIVPGWIMTERQKKLWATPEALAQHQKNQCLPDLIDPIYVAQMILFLASDDSAMCTASDFRVEAGSI